MNRRSPALGFARLPGVPVLANARRIAGRAALYAAIAATSACSGGGGGGGTTGPPTNKTPTATLTITPTTGLAPLTVTVQLTGADPDGTVVLYEADLNGDGDFNDTGESQAAPINAQATYNQTTAIKARVRDDRGALSAQKTRTVNVTQPPKLEVTVMGGSPDPGVGLIPIEGAYVLVGPAGGAPTDSVQTDANGIADIPLRTSGTLDVAVKDELDPNNLGNWYDLKPQQVSPNGQDTSITYGLVPVIPLPAGTTAYTDGADFNRQVVDNLSVVLRGLNDYPVKLFIDGTGATSQAHIDAARDGFNAWNANGYTMAQIVTDPAQADYTVGFSPQGSFAGIDAKIVNLDSRQTVSGITNIASHEFSHIAGHLLEGKDVLFCSTPPFCINGVTQFEQSDYTALEAIRDFYVVNFKTNSFDSN